MRSLRILPGIAVALLALAGVAAAVTVGMNMDGSLSVDDHDAAASSGLRAHEGGASGTLDARAGGHRLSGGAALTPPALPSAPGVPALPATPGVPPVPAAPEVPLPAPEAPALPHVDVPETPDMRAGASADGSASAATEHASASGEGSADVRVG